MKKWANELTESFQRKKSKGLKTHAIKEMQIKPH
jgi:hypothetical protein